MDQLNHPDQVLSMEGSVLPRMFNSICEFYDRPRIDWFATRANTKLPIYVSLAPDPMAWRQDAFQHLRDGLTTFAFPLLAILSQVLLGVLLTRLSLVLVASCWPQKD